MALPSHIARALGTKYGRRLVGDYDPNDPLGDAPAAPQYDVAVGPISINSRTPADGGGDELAAPEEMRPPLPPVPGGFKVSDGPDAEPDADADDSAHMAALATASRPPARTAPAPDESWGTYGDAKGLSQARASDRESILAEMFQRAGRQMISGLTRTPEAATVAGPADAEKRFLSAQAMRRDAALKALKDAREGRVADADVELKLAEADKARRLPVAPVAKPDHFADDWRNRFDLADKNNAEALRRARIAASAAPKNADAKDEQSIQELAKRNDDAATTAAAMQRLREKVAGLNDIPGVGKVDALLPDFVQSTEGLDIQNEARSLVDTLLKMQSGAGVSNQERANKYKQYGIGGSDERAFRLGLDRLNADLGAAMKAKEAGFKPSVVETYRKRGGTGAEDLPKVAPAAKVTVSNGKETLRIDPADLADAERDGYRRLP